MDRKRALNCQRMTLSGAIAILLSATPSLVTAQSGSCFSLSGSTACPAFSSASISKTEPLWREYSFLEWVTDRESFDKELSNYVKTTYVQEKYKSLFGCDNIVLTNSSDWYARFSTTVVCNALVQMSIEPCGLNEQQSASLCADSCAEFAQSEAYLTSDDSLCSSPVGNLNDLIRADFTNCALPRAALASRSCIDGADNESNNCGFGDSLIGLCSYCSEGGANSTDTCCYNAKSEDRCKGVDLPVITSTLVFETPTASTLPTGTSSPGKGTKHGGGLSGGVIAGIVIGVVGGIALIAALLFFCLRAHRRSSGSTNGSIFNQPSPARKGPILSHLTQEAPQGYEVLPGGRIARMSALEGHSGDSSSSPLRGKSASSGGEGAIPGFIPRKVSNAQSSSDEFGDSPESETRAGVLRPPPSTMRRNGSLSSNSVFNSVPQSPTSGDDLPSPHGLGSQQSEQLPFFKDYYSQDDIHPGDRVAVLWAYQPRASDEFGLERGDMLKVVGIWDDGWATGIMLNENAEEYEVRRKAQRDSGVSNASGRRGSSPAASGEIKAFPLVCVCLPDHWKKTIEGDGSTETGSDGHDPLANF